MTGRSPDAPIRWPAEAIWEAVAPVLPGFTVEVLPSIDSTNTELMRRARAGLAEPTLLVAELQTAGRGRLGRPWRGAVGDALMFSLGMPLAPADWSGLSLAVGVSVAESLQPTPLAGAARIGLKWPNDLWLDGDRKLAGILVETASLVAPGWEAHAAPATRYVVAGIGINVQPPQADGMNTPPGSLQDVEPGLDAPTALQRIAAPLVAMLQSFEAYGFAPVQARFHQRDVLNGRAVTLSDGTTGTAHGVGEDGALLVHTAQGMQAVTSSEISVRPAGPSAPR
ncbi:biotin--[acetyl-CoA-carboxylase] ligase [Acidovorax sp. SUPP3434]|uniref:biotin--[acetyl-CoA-carboxylase] ligase n=1 Tax=Acidovorax sp. SUPP3434 TaxID=2920880 RepID=UPI0023DE5D8A|nr:biotin--[acetyl-CoA-carboxylase] ligase [Acidovorax sp. SUPP3434]GKT00649.1 biotin--[acetyl-CoA-carboxylase] ligase [Acidovorax sp. SUPP3434]